MRMKHLVIGIASAAILSAPALAADAGKADAPVQAEAINQQDASIPFANLGGIRDWRADGENAVYIQDTFGRWYKAELFMPAFNLPFVQFIGIDARPTGTLDKFGAIYVDGERYPFKSFVRVAGPVLKNRK